MLFSKRDKITESYDVVVIGSGLAGMTAANMIGRSGRKVLLLEAHNKLGGLATWFKRKGGHVFDISLHGFPAGMIKTCRKYWSKDIANKIEQVKRVRFLNPQYELESDFTKEDFSKILVEHFNVKEETVAAFFDELANMNYYDPPEMNNGQLFEKYFPGRNDITRFLLEPIVYANGSNLEDPAISYGIVFSNFMSKGVYIFRGGTDMMISMMKEELLKNNVDIRLHSEVDEILLDDEKIVMAVRVGDEVIKTRSVVSNANIKKTIFDLVGETNFDEQFINEAKKVRLNTSSCQVFMGLKEGESIPDIGELIFCSDDEEFSTDKILSTDVKSQTFSVYYPDMRPHLGNRYAIVSSSNARYEDWFNLSKEEYKKRKDFLIQRALTALDKILPGIESKIDHIEASTPLTVEKYTHHLQGSSFGTKFEGLPISMNLHKQVPGLFHSGSVGIIMSGWLGAANYGVIQSHEVENYLFNLEKNEG